MIYTIRTGRRSVLLLVAVACFASIGWLGWHFSRDGTPSIESFDPMAVRFVEAPAPPGATSTQSPWKEAAVDSRPVVLATANKAFLDFTANWLESISRVGTKPRILMVAEDAATHQFLYGRPDVHVVVSQGFETPAGQLPWDSPIYNAMVNKRPAYIYQLLKQGHDVLFCDVDTVWLKDPFQYLEGAYDIAVEEDQHKPYIAYCAGFVFFRATEKTRKFVEEWLRRLHRSKTTISDQVLMNEMLTKNHIPGLRKRILPSEIFPNGKLFFMTPEWRRLHRDSAAVVHNNWILSKETKLERFKEHGLWFID